MHSIIVSEFGGSVFQFDARGWFNATGAATSYGKRPVDWLRMASTQRYVDALCRRHEVSESHFVQTHRGGDLSAQGSWLHPKLAVRFAQWLNIDFAVWCDEVIDGIMRGGQSREYAIWKELQAELAADAGSLVRASFGSRLMLNRKRDKPVHQEKIKRLKAELQPSLIPDESTA